MLPFRYPLVGDIDLDVVSSLAVELRSALDASTGDPVVLDCSGLQFIDARGVGMIVELRQDLDREGRRLVLQHARPAVRRLLDIVSLGDLTDVPLRFDPARRAPSPPRDEITSRRRAASPTAVTARGDRRRMLRELLDDLLRESGTDLGNIHAVDRARQGLRIEVHRGFGQVFLAHFAFVDVTGAGSRELLASGRRVVVADVTRDAGLADTPELEVLLAAGVHALHTAPVLAASGELLGAVSAHFRDVHVPDHRECAVLDAIARQAAHVLA